MAHARLGLARDAGAGARFFPVLADRDLEVEPDEVAAFLEECAMVRANLSALGPDPLGQVGVRLGNIEQAARRAMAVDGGRRRGARVVISAGVLGGSPVR